jgi:hypothetical protein
MSAPEEPTHLEICDIEEALKRYDADSEWRKAIADEVEEALRQVMIPSPEVSAGTPVI